MGVFAAFTRFAARCADRIVEFEVAERAKGAVRITATTVDTRMGGLVAERARATRV